MNELKRLMRWHSQCAPDIDKEQLVSLYRTLVAEEFKELKDAPNQGNEIKEAADLIVVAAGLIKAHGFDVEEVLKLVNDSNFSKFVSGRWGVDKIEGSYLREVEPAVFAIHRESDGKMLKPSTYKPVDESLFN